MRRRVLVVLAVLAGLLSPALASPAGASGDDYPYRTATTNTADPWGFTKRQCVSFVAWELYQRGRPITNRAGWGSAYHWDETARAMGKVVTGRPKAGAVAQWNAYEASAYYPATGGVGTIRAGGYGHVAMVTGVYSDGSVRIEQYNMFGTRSFSTMRVKAPRYLYVLG
jgi:surface antigen